MHMTGKTFALLGLTAALVAPLAVPVSAAPPDWAPAHGWRRKQERNRDNWRRRDRDERRRRDRDDWRRRDRDDWRRRDRDERRWRARRDRDRDDWRRDQIHRRTPSWRDRRNNPDGYVLFRRNPRSGPGVINTGTSGRRTYYARNRRTSDPYARRVLQRRSQYQRATDRFRDTRDDWRRARRTGSPNVRGMRSRYAAAQRNRRRTYQRWVTARRQYYRDRQRR
jgi:hypothetical protein